MFVIVPGFTGILIVRTFAGAVGGETLAAQDQIGGCKGEESHKRLAQIRYGDQWRKFPETAN
jgi:hypothetical protein